MSPPWRLFERAVADFLATLDPRARIAHDVRRPDRDTGTLRQRDVWIETSFGGHIPISILVSCKFEARALDIGDIDTFIGERLSSGAHVGVLYTHRGFTEPALLKARAVGVSCCTLFDNEPAQLPSALTLVFYCLTEQFRLIVSGIEDKNIDLADIFDTPLMVDGSRVSLVTDLVAKHSNKRASVVSECRTYFPPPTWETTFEYSNGEHQFQVGLRGGWKVYRAKQEATLVSGSYNWTNGNFKGAITGPWIDRRGPHPGPAWEHLESPPTQAESANAFAVTILHGGDMEAQIRSVFAGRTIATL